MNDTKPTRSPGNIEDLQKARALVAAGKICLGAIGEKRFKEFPGGRKGRKRTALARRGTPDYRPRGPTSIAKPPFAMPEQSEMLPKKLWDAPASLAGQFRARANLGSVWGSVLEHERFFSMPPAETLSPGCPQFAGDPHPWKFYPTGKNWRRRPPLRSTRNSAMFKEAEGAHRKNVSPGAPFLKTSPL